MASALVNHVNFRLLYNLNMGSAVYIVINCKQYCDIPIRMICNHRSREGGLNDIWQTDNLYFSELLPSEETITYYYFVADYDDPTRNRSEVNWQGTHERMQLSFKREIYKKSYCIITDLCNQPHEQKNQEGRIFRKQMENTLKFHISIVHELSEGQWLFVMLLPNEFESDPAEQTLMNAVRAKKIPMKSNPKLSKWTLDWVLGIQQFTQKYGGSLNLALFVSPYYHRIKHQWKPLIQKSNDEMGEEQLDNLDTLSQKLQKLNIPYLIEYQSLGKDKQISHHVLTNTKDFIKTKFSYVGLQQRKPQEIFGVWLISPNFEKVLMGRCEKDAKIWEVEVELQSEMLNGLQYLFEVKLFQEVQQQMPKKLLIKATPPQKASLNNPETPTLIISNKIPSP